MNLNKFSDYFKKQWSNGTFNNWQSCATPIGYSITNNPIESYNAVIIFFKSKKQT